MVSKARWLLGLGLALLVCFPVSALTFQKVGDGVLVQGEIVAGDFERFRNALDRYGNGPILLNSNGGKVGEALRIAELVRVRQVSTHLPGKATCASACVLILAGGVIRTAEGSARIGVHMGSGLLNDDSVETMRRFYARYGAEGVAVLGSKFEQSAALSVLKQVDFFLRCGVSLRLLEVSARVDHLDIKWLSAFEAREYNIINAD